MNLTPEEREFYEDHLKWLRIEANTLKKAEERGEARGEARGKVEGKAELIKMMLNNGISIDAISQMIGLSVDEIKKLLL